MADRSYRTWQFASIHERAKSRRNADFKNPAGGSSELIQRQNPPAAFTRLAPQP
jgi:hypothetical protein